MQPSTSLVHNAHPMPSMCHRQATFALPTLHSFRGCVCPPVLRSGGALVVKAIPSQAPTKCNESLFSSSGQFTSVKRQWHLIALAHTVSNSNSTMGQTIM